MDYAVILFLISLILSAFFSGSEMAFVSVSRLELLLHARKTGTVAWWEKKLQEPTKFIVTTLIGNNLALVLFGMAVGMLIWQYIPITSFSEASQLAVETVAGTVVIVIFGEYLPKNIARRYPAQWLKWLGPMFRVFYYLLYPITWIMMLLLPIKEKAKQTTAISRADLEVLLQKHVNIAKEKTVIGDLVRRALELYEKTVRDCMVPRVDVKAVEYNASIDEVKNIFKKTRHSRIVVYKEQIDNVVGYIHIFSLLEKPKSIEEIIKEMPMLTETTPVLKALEVLTSQRKSIAYVVDEYGALAGIVTLEDILEELVGDLWDEQEEEEQEVIFSEQENAYYIKGTASIDELNEEYGFNFPESKEYETIAGFIINQLGFIPSKGYKFTYEDYEIEVVEATRNRILKVKIKMKEN